MHKMEDKHDFEQTQTYDGTDRSRNDGLFSQRLRNTNQITRGKKNTCSKAINARVEDDKPTMVVTAGHAN